MTKRSKVMNDMYGKVSNPAVTYERFLVVDLFRSITKKVVISKMERTTSWCSKHVLCTFYARSIRVLYTFYYWPDALKVVLCSIRF